MEDNQKQKNEETLEPPSAVQTLLTTVIFLMAKVIIMSYVLQFGWNNSLAELGLQELKYGQALSLYLLLSVAASIVLPQTAYRPVDQKKN